MCQECALALLAFQPAAACFNVYSPMTMTDPPTKPVPSMPPNILPRPASLMTFSTGSSSSTVWGPGAHAGRALKAFGEALTYPLISANVKRWLSKQASIVADHIQLDALSDEEFYKLCMELADLSR